MRRKLIVGNWKMHGTLAENAGLLSAIRDGADLPVDLAVCVPAPYLAQCQQQLSGSGVQWGAQDVSSHACGAYTGEVAATMLNDFGCHVVTVGHSERRAYHGESNVLVAQKTVRALAAGITPIVCLGETPAQRNAGETQDVIGAQLGAVLQAIAASEGDTVASLRRLVLAYEPVWAIGTGKTATPQMAQDAHAFLRAVLSKINQQAGSATRILYGGSVKPDNAADLFAMPDIDGGLIGGAALKAADFLAIARAAA